MNRERILFVAVLAIVALWYFLLREEVVIHETAEPARRTLTSLSVRSTAYPDTHVRITTPYGPFELVTNVVDYPRPDLSEMVSDYLDTSIPKPFTIPNVWPPTSRCVSLDRLGWLRRWPAAPGNGEGALQLPPLPETADAGPTGEKPDRIDTWESNRQSQRGRIEAIWVKGEQLREPREIPRPGEEKQEAFKFYYYLCLLQVDPERAVAEGVTDVRARIENIGGIKQRIGEELTNVKVGVEGKHKGFLDGFKRALRLPEAGFQARYQLGRDLLQEGVKERDTALVEWALVILQRAKEQLPAGVQAERRKILLLMLDAANRLNRQELVLKLAIEHLAAFPDEEEVLAYVGNILASRSFNLLEFAADWFELARSSPYAQRRLVEVRIRLGQFRKANEVLERGGVGSGAVVDLLRARVALALGDLDTAASRARNHTTSSDDTLKADAYQILGAVSYVHGKAAEAAGHFLSAVNADPGRSTAYSDLGLALAVQGKSADAMTCFQRALQLDPIDNSVPPKVGEAYLKLAAGDGGLRAAENVEVDPRYPEAADQKRQELRQQASAAFGEAVTMLTTLTDEAPSELFVRYLLGYAKEMSGNLDEAAKLYRSTIDADFRYRIAIARLGLVQAALVEAGGSRDLVPLAVAHLEKAVALNPDDAVLPYVLGRFLLMQRLRPGLADKVFGEAEKLEVGEKNGDLPLWAQLARACLAYRSESNLERQVKGDLNALLARVKDLMPSGSTEAQLMQHEVYKAAFIALEIVKETENKVNKTWAFQELASRPPDWKYHNKNPMHVAIVRGKGLVFSGEVDYGGENPGPQAYEWCGAEYGAASFNGRNFYELEVKGTAPDTREVDLGIAVVNQSRTKRGPQGIQVRRKARTGNVEIRLDGGEDQKFKAVKGRDYVEMKSVAWPAGEFTLVIKVEPEYEKNRRTGGRFRLFLNGVNVFETELGTETERSAIFGRGRSNQKIFVQLWAEGREGVTIPPVAISSVRVTMQK